MFYTDVPERVGPSILRGLWNETGAEPAGISVRQKQVGSKREEERWGERRGERGACWWKPLLGTRELPSRPLWAFEWLGVEQADMSFVEIHHGVMLHRWPYWMAGAGGESSCSHLLSHGEVAA